MQKMEASADKHCWLALFVIIYLSVHLYDIAQMEGASFLRQIDENTLGSEQQRIDLAEVIWKIWGQIYSCYM